MKIDDEHLLKEIHHELREITSLYYNEELWTNNVTIHNIYRKLMFSTISIHKYIDICMEKIIEDDFNEDVFIIV